LITVEYLDWTFSSDVEKTISAYRHAKGGSADSCTCENCKNFVQLRDSIYPEKIKILFESLGIDFKKEPEVSYFARLENGLHYYSGFFHFKGSYTGKNCAVPLPGSGYNLELTPITDTFKLGVHMGSSRSFFEDREELVQIEFSIEAPWVLSSTEPK
jgi:hypothetical protein